MQHARYGRGMLRCIDAFHGEKMLSKIDSFIARESIHGRRTSSQPSMQSSRKR